MMEDAPDTMCLPLYHCMPVAAHKCGGCKTCHCAYANCCKEEVLATMDVEEFKHLNWPIMFRLCKGNFMTPTAIFQNGFPAHTFLFSIFVAVLLIFLWMFDFWGIEWLCKTMVGLDVPFKFHLLSTLSFPCSANRIGSLYKSPAAWGRLLYPGSICIWMSFAPFRLVRLSHYSCFEDDLPAVRRDMNEKLFQVF